MPTTNTSRIKGWPVIVFLCGFLVGTIVAWIWKTGSAPVGPLATETSTVRLARDALGKAAQQFVADTSAEFPTSDGVGFYEQPRPVGEVLCRVNATWIDGQIIRGVPRTVNIYDPGIETRVMFGVWPKSFTGEFDRTASVAGCRAYRDFEHLIYSDDVVATDRAVIAVGKAIENARSGQLAFQTTCTDGRRAGPPRHCDARSILRTLEVNDIRSVTAATTGTPPQLTFVDEVYVDLHEDHGQHPEAAVLRVTTRQEAALATVANTTPGKVEILIEAY